ncbi:Chemotaxis protein methyltransferase [Anaerohalosphaera lusitana]|uniref:protein-glutamate O-methyltransferase n=1 Tax=Anaerohalosphaera lusitana TaxID=1936003 RepID=A0A1U9NGK0_9BACT|nr:protein-glutamate O-methyltransferase [Anaerohalosphaera lusitana]AQT66878.1 Chemotaxis protein methyltransferase [Anaerohalosphaera lusitana]
MVGCTTYSSDANLTDDDFRQVSRVIYEHCGINLHDGKKELVRARLAKRMRVTKRRSISDYLSYALRDHSGKEFSLLVDAISTNLTSFFREQKHFDFLCDEFLPSLITKKRASGDKVVRAWSAGCSSGEEPYSLAITLLSELKNAPEFQVKILATDISTTVLDRARTGIYPEKRVAPVPAELKHRYLIREKSDGEKMFRVAKILRECIYFGQLNLMQEWPIKVPLDFIFCRNVMIYFDKPTQERLVNRYYDILQPGGVLFTGHSESLTGIKHRFRYVQPTIYAKV